MGAPRSGYSPVMDPRHEPDQVDPSKQSGRPLMVTLVPLGLITALAVLVLVYFLAK
jgi:hypothetical protein